MLIPFNPSSGTVGKSIEMPGSRVAVAPGGKHALAFSGQEDGYVVDLGSGRISPPIVLGPFPESVAFSPDGTMAYVADAGEAACIVLCARGPGVRPSDYVTPLDMETGRVESPIHVCSGPLQVAMSPQGKTLWVSCGFAGVESISLASGHVSHYDVPGSPGNISFTDGGRTVVVGQIFVEDLQTVSPWINLINTATGKVSKSIVVGRPGITSVAALTPQGIAYVNTWGWPTPPQPHAPAEYTTEIVPLDLHSRQLGPALSASGHQRVLAVGYWPGVGVRYLTAPDANGVVIEYDPADATTVRILTSARDSAPLGLSNLTGLVAVDPSSPVAIMQIGSEATAPTRELETLNLMNGTVSHVIPLPVAVSYESVAFDGGPSIDGFLPSLAA